jgi:hypothetical protein
MKQPENQIKYMHYTHVKNSPTIPRMNSGWISYIQSLIEPFVVVNEGKRNQKLHAENVKTL